MSAPAEIARANGRKGGRPVGSATKLTRSLANELMRQGLDGLSGMVNNMLFWRDRAQELEALAMEQLKSEDDATRKEGLRTMKPLMQARMNFHTCARDVAPYTNPPIKGREPDVDEQTAKDSHDFTANIGPTQIRLVTDNTK